MTVLSNSQFRAYAQAEYAAKVVGERLRIYRSVEAIRLRPARRRRVTL